MRSIRKALFMSLCIAGSAMLVPAVGSAGVAIGITVAPPVAPVEVVPPPRVGFVWAPGYYEWNGSAHVWVPGRWVGARPGYHWVPDRWDHRGGYWHHYEGHWAH
ncbi:MAG: hypothetical protein ACLP2F_16945 [Steroidobacteraceae bacterium]